MPTARKSRSWSIALLAAVIAAHLGYTTYAVRNNAAPLEPATLATVNLEVVFAALDERAAHDIRLTAIAEDLDLKAQEKRNAIMLAEQDLEIYQPGSEERDRETAKVAEDTVNLRAFIEYSARRIDSEQSRVLSSIYLEIKLVLAQISAEYGFDIVFVDDSVVELPQKAPEQDMMRQISARRMLYTNPEIDITEMLIEEMNKRFAAGIGP